MRYIKKYETHIIDYDHNTDFLVGLYKNLKGYRIIHDDEYVTIVNKSDNSALAQFPYRDLKTQIINWIKEMYISLQDQKDNEFYYKEQMDLVDKLSNIVFGCDAQTYVENEEIGLL